MAKAYGFSITRQVLIRELRARPIPALVVYQLNVSVIYQRVADMAYQLHIRLYQVAYQVDISSRAYQAVSGAYQLDMHLIRCISS